MSLDDIVIEHRKNIEKLNRKIKRIEKIKKASNVLILSIILAVIGYTFYEIGYINGIDTVEINR